MQIEVTGIYKNGTISKTKVNSIDQDEESILLTIIHKIAGYHNVDRGTVSQPYNVEKIIVLSKKNWCIDGRILTEL